MSLTELVKRTFIPDVLREQDISLYENFVHVPANTDTSTATSITIDQNQSGSDIISNLQDSYLLVNWHLRLATGVDIPAASGAANEVRATLPNSAWALFRQIRLELANEIVDQCNSPSHVFNMKAKISKSRAWVDANKNDMFYYPQNGQYSHADFITDANFVEGSNILIAASLDASPAGIWSKLRLKDVLGIANCKKVFPYSKLTLRLDKETNYNTIISRRVPGSVANADLMTVIKSVKWYVPGMRIRQDLGNEFLTKAVISKTPIPYNWLQYGYTVLPLPSSPGVTYQVNLFSTIKKMRHLFVAIQPQSYIASQIIANDTNCSKSSYRAGTVAAGAVTEFYVNVGGRQMPFMRFGQEGYKREVEALLSAYGKQNADGNNAIVNGANFLNENMIYYIDMSHVDAVSEENASDVSVQININTTAAANAPNNLHCMFFSEMSQALTLVDGIMRMRNAA